MTKQEQKTKLKLAHEVLDRIEAHLIGWAKYAKARSKGLGV